MPDDAGKTWFCKDGHTVMSPYAPVCTFKMADHFRPDGSVDRPKQVCGMAMYESKAKAEHAYSEEQQKNAADKAKQAEGMKRAEALATIASSGGVKVEDDLMTTRKPADEKKKLDDEGEDISGPKREEHPNPNRDPNNPNRDQNPNNPNRAPQPEPPKRRP